MSSFVNRTTATDFWAALAVLHVGRLGRHGPKCRSVQPPSRPDGMPPVRRADRLMRFRWCLREPLEQNQRVRGFSKLPWPNPLRGGPLSLTWRAVRAAPRWNDRRVPDRSLLPRNVAPPDHVRMQPEVMAFVADGPLPDDDASAPGPVPFVTRPHQDSPWWDHVLWNRWGHYHHDDWVPSDDY